MYKKGFSRAYGLTLFERVKHGEYFPQIFVTGGFMTFNVIKNSQFEAYT